MPPCPSWQPCVRGQPLCDLLLSRAHEGRPPCRLPKLKAMYAAFMRVGSTVNSCPERCGWWPLQWPLGCPSGCCRHALLRRGSDLPGDDARHSALWATCVVAGGTPDGGIGDADSVYGTHRPWGRRGEDADVRTGSPLPW